MTDIASSASATTDASSPEQTPSLLHSLAEINKHRIQPLTLDELQQMNAWIDEYWEEMC